MPRFATLLFLLLAPTLVMAQKDIGATASFASGGPENDALANAITITGDGEYLSSVTGATAEAGEASASCQGTDSNQSVWWIFTPSVDGTITLDTDGSIQEPPGTQFTDTILTVYTGTGHPLTELVCNDDDPGNTATGDFTSRIADFAVTAGTTYYIRVSSYAQGRIDGEARLSFSGPALVSNEEAPEIRRLALSPALPNPTVGRTEMTLSVGTPQTLDVGVYDVLGRRVLDVYTGAAAADLSLVIQTTTLRSGTYVVRATGEATAATRTFTVVR